MLPEFVLEFINGLFYLFGELAKAWNNLPKFPVADPFGTVQNRMITLVYLAPMLQVAGYVTYMLFAFWGRNHPNPWSWLMFAYGTSLLTWLEYKLGAPLVMLFLPAVCAVMSILVFCFALIASLFSRGSSIHILDPIALIADLALTVGYFWSAQQLMHGDITSASHNSNMFWFLVLTNATTLTAFSPLIREGLAKAGHEAPIPWLIWAVAYGCLGVLTFMQEGLFSVLMIYPILSAVLHFAVGIMSIGGSRNYSS